MTKKGGTYVCVPCGTEVVVTESGTSYTDIMCCGLAMAPKPKARRGGKAPAKKKAKKKGAVRKTAAKKASSRKPAKRKKK
jgi:hypothetical protein